MLTSMILGVLLLIMIVMMVVVVVVKDKKITEAQLKSERAEKAYESIHEETVGLDSGNKKLKVELEELRKFIMELTAEMAKRNDESAELQGKLIEANTGMDQYKQLSEELQSKIHNVYIRPTLGDYELFTYLLKRGVSRDKLKIIFGADEYSYMCSRHHIDE